MILGWLLRSRKWFYIGLGIGVVVGAMRVFQGGHFISDSILAGFMVYWTIWLVAKWMKVPGPDDSEFDAAHSTQLETEDAISEQAEEPKQS